MKKINVHNINKNEIYGNLILVINNTYKFLYIVVSCQGMKNYC